jgi:hypothetical protein
LLALSLSYRRDKDKDTDACLCHEKRSESQHRRRYDAKRGRMRQGSIRDYNLRSSYPLRLCQWGLYWGRPPNVSQRINAEVTQNVVTAGLWVTNSVRNNGRNLMRARWEGGRDRCSCTRTPSYQCGCTRTPNYHPAPMNPPTERELQLDSTTASSHPKDCDTCDYAVLWVRDSNKSCWGYGHPIKINQD